METPEELKVIVKAKYSEIANQSKEQNAASCCGATCGCSTDDAIFAEDYSKLAGYVPDADLALGCGIPVEVAAIKTGDSVLDLGSGAGNDVFVARRIVGESGKVIGVDLTDAMIAKAKSNNEKLGYRNVEFRQGDIERLPVDSASVDVVISNCVLNLVPDKPKAFAEIFRVLKPGAHFAISDVVTTGALPESIKSAAELYVGCVSGAIEKEEYLMLMKKTGFTNVEVKKEKEISVPNKVLVEYLGLDELRKFKSSGAGILSITVFGEKP
ncbi:MAG: arsenite methyltransferase [Bacteroidota bacterium]